MRAGVSGSRMFMASAVWGVLGSPGLRVLQVPKIQMALRGVQYGEGWNKYGRMKSAVAHT
jgi:hypothetical protein